MCYAAQRRLRKYVGFLLLPAAALLPGCVTAAFRETRTVTMAHQADAPLRVHTANGSITVKQAEVGDVTISAELKAVTAERLAEAEVVAAREADGTLAVGVDWPNKRRSNEGCNFTVTLPNAKGVELDTSNGRVTLSGLGGRAALRSSNGPVIVERHDGPVDVTTSNGDVRLSQIAGDALVETSNGNINIDGACGAGEARTSNGEVRVHLADASRGPLKVQSSNGDVHLELGRAFAGELSLHTSNGRVNVDELQDAKLISMSPNSLRLRFGEGGVEGSTVTTSNGSITIRR